MRYIELPNKEKRRLGMIFNVSAVTVWSALTYKTNSPLANRIRAAARKAGGTEMRRLSIPADFGPDCEIEYMREDGHLTGILQTFDNAVTVVLDCKSGCAELCLGGTTLKTYQEITVSQWPEILFEAQHMVQSLEN